ncbi:MAG: hypothetical protein ABJE95_27545 [Byssovorax sp.]
MKTCVICGCDDDHACSVTFDGRETCHWVNDDPPVCSQCGENVDALIELLAREPLSSEALVARLAGGDDEAGFAEELRRAIAHLVERGDLELDAAGVLHATAPWVPDMHRVATVAGCEIYSPGTFTVGEGWGAVRSDLAAAVRSAAADGPSIIVPFWAAPKEPS